MQKKKILFIVGGLMVLTAIAMFFLMSGETKMIQQLLQEPKEARIYERALISPDVLMNETLIDDMRKDDSYYVFGEMGKEYIADEKRLIITNDSKTVMDLKLLTPYMYSGLIASKDTKIAEFYLGDHDGESMIFDDFELFDVKSDYREIEKRELRFKYLVVEQQCTGQEKEEYCEVVERWKEFKDLKEVPKDTKISIWTETHPREVIEIVPQIKGFDVLEWMAWNISDAEYLQNYSVVSESGSGYGVRFADDRGDVFYVQDFGTDRVYQYNLTDEWNVTSATNIGSCYYGGDEGIGYGHTVGKNGTRIYIAGRNEDIMQYNLGTPYVASTCTYSAQKITATDYDTGVAFSKSGEKMWVIYTTELIEVYNCSTAWEVSTCSLESSITITETASATDVRPKEDGTKMYVSGGIIVYEYDLSDPHNVSSATYVQSKDLTSQDTGMGAIDFSPDGMKFYAQGSANDLVYEYDITQAEDTVPITTLVSPSNGYDNTTLTDLDFTCSATDYLGQLANVTWYLWNVTSGSVINSSTEQWSGETNSSTFNHNFTSWGGYKWNCLVVDNNSDSDWADTNWTVNFTLVDDIYPQFSSYWDDNASLEDSGTGHFNVTVTDTNGTVLLEINGTNETASNVGGDVYSATHVFSVAGVYPYKWHSWGDGFDENYNVSATRSYTVNESEPEYTLSILEPLTASPLSCDAGDNITLRFLFLEDTTNITSGVSINNITIDGDQANVVQSGGGGSPTTIDFETFDTGTDLQPVATDWYTYYAVDSGCVWWKDSDGTASSSTGPCSGSSNCATNDAGYDDNYYAYVETSSANCNIGTASAYLQYDDIDMDTYGEINFTFAYNMYGTNMGNLSFQIDDGVGGWIVLWSLTGNQGTAWFTDSVDLSSYSGTRDIRFEYYRNGQTSYYGDVAIDILNVTNLGGAVDEIAWIDGSGWNVNVTVPSECNGSNKDLFINASWTTYDAWDTETGAINCSGGGGEPPVGNCWTETNGLIAIPSGCKYYTNTKEFILP